MNLKPPSQALLQAINLQLIAARGDADPQIMVQGRYLKKYRQRLYCLHADRLQKIADDLHWEPDKQSLNLGNGYRLALLPSASGMAQRLWDSVKVMISPRRGGEKLKLPGRNGRHCLKKLYQEAGIPPWERENRPLIYLDGRLAGVAGLWVDEWACASETEACYQIVWEYADIKN
jgi:tRNA(Ile)-lysidine synthase